MGAADKSLLRDTAKELIDILYGMGSLDELLEIREHLNHKLDNVSSDSLDDLQVKVVNYYYIYDGDQIDGVIASVRSNKHINYIIMKGSKLDTDINTNNYLGQTKTYCINKGIIVDGALTLNLGMFESIQSALQFIYGHKRNNEMNEARKIDKSADAPLYKYVLKKFSLDAEGTDTECLVV